ncbi:MAG TPA: type 1 glutamine amidotransferase [Burkholderiaceae bacterium]|nr:type 1 glutamine amidotransferase [Burkholderiaceae bacterium]
MIAILQFHPNDGPSTLATWLRARGVPFNLVDLHAGDALPKSLGGIHAIAALGGPMSVNDALPMLRDTEALLRDALAHDVPVLGHCLGGQLLASALGARIRRNSQPEIGWHEVRLECVDRARHWFGARESMHVFQWHYDTFDIPEGAARIATNAHCANQAFCIGRSVGMQFHIEINLDTLDLWAEHGAPELVALEDLPSVQTITEQRADTARHLATSQAIAAHMYERWLQDAGVLPIQPSPR